jgi:flagellin-like hook-associated protein FlgL
MTDPIILNSAMRLNLLAFQRTQSLIDRTTLRLATGLKVSSALDNPQNHKHGFQCLHLS